MSRARKTDLMAKVEIDPDSGCWMWTGAGKGNGYGNIRNTTAHKYFYIVFRGEVPDGLDVCHHCDVRGCVNPGHLFLGSRKENMQDAKTKGRTATGFDLPHTKLSSSDVSAIAASTEHARIIAPRYGISIKYAQRIQNYGTRY